MKDCAFEVLPLAGKDVFLFLHTTEPVTSGMWTAALEAMRESERRHEGSIEQMALLVVTDGGAPDPSMRNELSKLLRGRKLRISVITEHVMARGVVTAISWFNPAIKAFSPKAVVSSLEHLDLSQDHLSELLRVFRKMEIATGAVSTLGAIPIDAAQAHQ